MKVFVKSGHHDRRNCLACVALPEGTEISESVHLEDAAGQTLPAQVVDGGRALLFLLKEQLADAEAEYEIKPGATAQEQIVSVVAGENGETYDVRIDGRLFTTLHCSDKWAKPFMFPVMNTRDVPVTRAFPIIPDVPGETHDHPHQKSLWTAWGDVNGTDIWGEARDYGKIVTKKVEVIEGGPLRVTLRLALDWVTSAGVKLMSEIRDLSFAAPGDVRTVDFKVVFSADCGDVTFGDTKEGGLCSVRVASSMDGTGAGMIRLSDGSVGENECWGKRACWCDYYGAVSGGMTGICIMDNPQNFRFPTYWHVRNYGLMTANPFGVSYFTGDKAKCGTHQLPAGSTETWLYRVVFHENEPCKARLAERYQDYAHAPVCAIKD
ncbi:MAG: PmoA family protein [Victivallales bacterium]|nr:PmoA family protein [Victivallales bacterium]